MAMVRAELDDMGAEYRFVNQRQAAHYRLSWEIRDGEFAGPLESAGESHDIRSIRAADVRLMDGRLAAGTSGAR